MTVGLRKSLRIIVNANSNKVDSKKDQSARDSNLPVRVGNQPAHHSSLTVREGNQPARDSSLTVREGNQPARDSSLTVREGNQPARDSSLAVREEGNQPARDSSLAVREEGNQPARDSSLAVREEGNQPARDSNLTVREGNQPARDSSLTVRDGNQPARDSNLTVREGSQPARDISLTVRVGNEETIFAEGGSSTTISSKDLSQLRAKTYTNITTVQGKKTYKCNYCINSFNLFTDLKLHIGNNHLEGGSKHGRVPHQISNQSTDQNEALNNMLRKKPPSSQQLQDFQVQNAEFLCLLCQSTYPSKSSALKHSLTKKHLRAKENNVEATQQVTADNPRDGNNQKSKTTEKSKRGRPLKKVGEQRKPENYEHSERGLREKLDDKDGKIKELQDRLETYDKLSKLRDKKSEDLVSRLEMLKSYVEESSTDRYLANKINDIYTDALNNMV